MKNQYICFQEEEETVSAMRINENIKSPQSYYLLSNVRAPVYCNHPIDKQPNIYHYNDYFDQHYSSISSHLSPASSYYENSLKEKNLMDLYYRNRDEMKQSPTCDYHQRIANPTLPDQNWPLYETVPIPMSFSTDRHMTVKRKPNTTKSRYMDYMKNKDKPIDEIKIRSQLPTHLYYEEDLQSLPVYSVRKNQSRASKENENSCFIHPGPDDVKSYFDQVEDLDRRSKLCNYIMDQPFPMNQSPTDYEEVNFKERPVKARYMDFYYKTQDEKKESAEYDSPTHSSGEGFEETRELKSRYNDFKYKNLDKSKESYEHCSPETDSNPEHNYRVEAPSLHFSDDQSPIKQANATQIPNAIKSRYMDWDKEKSLEVLRKAPIKISHLDWKDYHRVHTIHTFLDDMQYNFPSICTTGVIGSSLENRDLKVLKVSNSECENASVWIDAGIHAREWIAPAVNTYIINHVVTNFNELPDSMKNKDWYFLPVMNPDGYEFSHTNYRMWRKNKAWHGNECLGVDLNRNFSCGWGGQGSSDDPKSPFYRGPRPFSEPESRAVRDMLKSTGINFKVYITLHSFGEVILFPFAYRSELCPDYIRLLEGATAMSKAINATNGNIYKVGISRDVMYGAAGTSCDWSYGEAKIPFCYLLELRSKKHKFRLPEIEIEETGKEILSCIMALMNFVDNYDVDGKLIENPSCNDNTDEEQ